MANYSAMPTEVLEAEVQGLTRKVDALRAELKAANKALRGREAEISLKTKLASLTPAEREALRALQKNVIAPGTIESGESVPAPGT